MLQRRVAHRYLVLGALAFLASCESPVPRQAEFLRTTSPCCSSIAEIPVSATLESAALTFEITDETKSFDFPQGRSHFVTVGLKPGPTRKLEVQTWTKGSSKFELHVFCPMVTLLDRNRAIVGTVELKNMAYTPATFVEGARFSQVTDLQDAADYAVVHTNGNLAARAIFAPYYSPRTVMMVGSGVAVSPGTDRIGVNCGHQGKITLSVR